MIPVVLASQSPARRQILTASGIDPVIVVSHVDEAAIEASFAGDVPELTCALSEAKARAVIESLRTRTPPQLLAEADAAGPGADGARTVVLIAGDSLLELDGRPVGKPGTAERTREVWTAMAGRWATLHTGHTVAVLDVDPGRRTCEVRDLRSARSSTGVLMGRPSEAELEAYIATEEPFGVAGALTIDGFGGAFVDRLDGDHLTVLGLSLPLVRRLVTDMGLFWPDLWSSRR
ncbi:septum formation protein [Brevibacterium sanguinis]|uniref:Nucleoside triphosphate pyrophosphatase n=2 Tax=Brevibacterium TaxID=1696 RepID=A0A366IKS3_9MICO|nr:MULTISPECIES: nucleoside triphosphate pyrophosphatase [Brevibacterium]RBP66167.1 septum formation protein [Brevibacterium sanguinis]RBP72818.1 septum formation protein [Brevibacterium celere]